MTIDRRHVVNIKIGADDWESVLQAIAQIEFDLSRHEPGNINIVSGGPNSGWIITDKFNPEQTHDHYFEEIDREAKQ